MAANRPPSASGSRRLGTGQRPPTTSAQRPPTTSAMRPGTASRLATAAAMNQPGTARTSSTRGSPVGGGSALNTQIQVLDRPTTQQGLGGIKTAVKGSQRMVQDRSYYLGVLRTRIAELNTEIERLSVETENFQRENSQFLLYEKKAEALAQEIKDLQGELVDYNTLLDKVNTDRPINEVQDDVNYLKQQNDTEAKNIDTIFTNKQEKEQKLQALEREVEQERQLADTLVAHMDVETKSKYCLLRDKNAKLLADLADQQNQLDTLNARKGNLEDEIAVSHIKQEAVSLYNKLHEMERKRDSLLTEAQMRGTPEEEREKLLKRVKEDNQEIASMERQVNDIKEKIVTKQNEIKDLESELEEQHGERNVKYRELKKREETIDEFIETFEETKAAEVEQKVELEMTVVAQLEQISRSINRFGHIPSSASQLQDLRSDLSFKETEMKKSETTAMTLEDEHGRLKQDLTKVEQLEEKITTELEVLQKKINSMQEELVVLSNLDALKESAEERKRTLEDDRVNLKEKLHGLREEVALLNEQFEKRRAQLQDNEVYTQLQNLEKKLQHHEQNNYVMTDFIASKSAEANYTPVKANALDIVRAYNKHIIDDTGKVMMRD